MKCVNVTTSIGIGMLRAAAIFCTKGAIYYDDFQAADKITVSPEGKDAYTLEYPILYRGFEYQIREISRYAAAGMNSSDILKPEDTVVIMDISMSCLRAAYHKVMGSRFL